MARHRRIEYPGACYLVVVRPQVRGGVLATESGEARVEYSLAEAAERSRWRVISWRVGKDGLWLAVQTKDPNLSVSMQWLVSTLAARSLERGRRSGAPARRRYRAVVVEPGDVFGRVGLALDLETSRAAGSRAQAASLPASSLQGWDRPLDRPDWFDPSPALMAAGIGVEEGGAAAGEAYVSRLQRWIDGTEDKPQLPHLHRGWIIGSESFRQEIEARLDREPSTARNAEAERGWSEVLAALLDRLPPSERADLRVSALWRAALAFVMKTRTTASNVWLARALGLSTPTFVSRQAAFVRNGLGGENARRVLSLLGEVSPSRLPPVPRPPPAALAPGAALAALAPFARAIPVVATSVPVADEEVSWRRFEGLE